MTTTFVAKDQKTNWKRLSSKGTYLLGYLIDWKDDQSPVTTGNRGLHSTFLYLVSTIFFENLFKEISFFFCVDHMCLVFHLKVILFNETQWLHFYKGKRLEYKSENSFNAHIGCTLVQCQVLGSALWWVLSL